MKKYLVPKGTRVIRLKEGGALQREFFVTERDAYFDEQDLDEFKAVGMGVGPSPYPCVVFCLPWPSAEPWRYIIVPVNEYREVDVIQTEYGKCTISYKFDKP